MNVRLPENLERYVKSLVEHGAFAGDSEVVQEALLEHQARRQGMEIMMTPHLERALNEGMEDSDRVKTTDDLRG